MIFFKKKPTTSVVYLSTFPPRECGIATFTEDLVNAMDDFLSPSVGSMILAMDTPDQVNTRYPSKVKMVLSQDDKEAYINAAKKINSDKTIALVSIQHEFGIFGGEYGEHLLSFLEVIEIPVVITFHTILPGPNNKLREIVIKLSEKVSSIVVMTGTSKNILVNEYDIPDDKISIIPHGIHAVAYTLPSEAKRDLNLGEHQIISTFGLLNKGKGIDYIIESLPPVIEKFPSLLYLILGATHPVVVRQEGETYRESLELKVKELGLEKNVLFYNKYFPLPELLDFLKATDVYVSPSQNPNQAVSGTLSYALGTGRPVISTAFQQAREYITPDVGSLVEFGSSKGFSHALIDMLQDPHRMLSLGKNAYFKTRHSTWQNVAISYSKIFSTLSPAFAAVSEEKMIPPLKLDHLFHLTDDFGIVQFATLDKPDIVFGYTLDDNVRALMVAVQSLDLGYLKKEAKRLERIIATYLAFIEKCQTEEGIFINYIHGNRTLDLEMNNITNLEDANGRAMFALAFAITNKATPKEAKHKAQQMLERSIRAKKRYQSPRANAFKIKCFAELIKYGCQIEGVDLNHELSALSNMLVTLYDRVHSKDWLWFEESLTYSNAVLPEALFDAYEVMPSRKYIEVAEITLNFLIIKSFMHGMYMPIGQEGWYKKGGPRNLFDQQPEDVTAMVFALHKAHKITKKKKYEDLKRKTFNWFLGENILKQVVYDRTTGGCFDGVRNSGVNLNQGAESTLSYLIARLSF
jgi:glycosyltransferase involved in cell wall biosynthesis